jgi:hypothetical protein
VNRGLAAAIGAVVIAGAVVVLVMQGDGDDARAVSIEGPSTSSAVGSDSTTTSQNSAGGLLSGLGPP